jgi:hypothetical protein
LFYAGAAGTSISAVLQLQKGFRLVKIETVHYDATKAEATSWSQTILLNRAAGKVTQLPYHADTLWDEPVCRFTQRIRDFGETFEFEPTTFTLALSNPQVAHYWSVVPYIQMEA